MSKVDGGVDLGEAGYVAIAADRNAAEESK